jgi:hypothetical protein
MGTQYHTFKLYFEHIAPVRNAQLLLDAGTNRLPNLVKIL